MWSVWRINETYHNFILAFSGPHTKDNDFLLNWKRSHTKQNKNILLPGAKTKETGASINISPSKLWRVSWSEWECFLSGILKKHNGEGGVWGVQCFRLSPVGAWWNTSWRVIEVWSRAALWGHLSYPLCEDIVPHTLSLLFVQWLYAPQVMGLPPPPWGNHPTLELSLLLRRLPWYSAQVFLSVITSHSSLPYPFLWPRAVLSLHRCAYTFAWGEYLILSPFCCPWALLIPAWCCRNPYK